MELATILPQLGTAGAFAWFAWKLYSDMRSDADKREKKSEEREAKLMEHLEKQTEIADKQGETNREVAATLKNIHERLCDLEDRGKCNV